MDDRERQRLMGERLAAMRPLLMLHMANRFRLQEWDAEEIYSETCVYMLERGYQLIRMDHNFDAAIMNTMKRRALNHIRDAKTRDQRGTTNLGHIREHSTLWADGQEQEAEWIYQMDKEGLENRATHPYEKMAMTHLLDHHSLSVKETAEYYGINPNTLQARVRRARQHLRDYLDE